MWRRLYKEMNNVYTFPPMMEMTSSQRSVIAHNHALLATWYYQEMQRANKRYR